MLSVGKLSQEEFTELRLIAVKDPRVAEFMEWENSAEIRHIWYVMPADLYISEVPMYLPYGQFPSHESPRLKDQSRFKIIITRAEFGNSGPAEGLEILRNALNKTPLIEIWINRNTHTIEKVIEAPAEDLYFGMPVPVF